jgi:rhodanese-related sulfurtransferase
MTPFPLPLQDIFGHWGAYVVYLVIGFAFGYVLEIAGFGKSTKLAAQFYLKDMTVLKVMFTGIIVAMVLIFLASGLGLLDYNLIWVNPTYLWPGIVGGLIMGVGFIVGGFCPGTSLVSAATLKIDGIIFALGVFFGIFVFGETVSLFEDFWYSSYMGRFTLPDLFNADTSIVVLGVVVFALAAFAFAEFCERIFGRDKPVQMPRWRLGAAGGLVILAGAALLVGQPTNADRWARLAPEKEPLLENRTVQVHPGELLQYIDNRQVITYMIDIRSESDFNQFHIRDAHHIPLANLLGVVPELQLQPTNTIFVIIGNGETAATDAWRMLAAESVPNIYILEGGINNWLDIFSDEAFRENYRLAAHEEDQLAYRFPAALGERYPAATPNPDVFQLTFEPRVQMVGKRGATSGGCG